MVDFAVMSIKQALSLLQNIGFKVGEKINEQERCIKWNKTEWNEFIRFEEKWSNEKNKGRKTGTESRRYSVSKILSLAKRRIFIIWRRRPAFNSETRVSK